MKYKKDVPSQDIADALSLNKSQVKRLIDAIQKAYDQHWDNRGPNIDQIYAQVAPYIKSEEEAFYVANVVVTDVLGAINSHAIQQSFNVN